MVPSGSLGSMHTPEQSCNVQSMLGGGEGGRGGGGRDAPQHTHSHAAVTLYGSQTGTGSMSEQASRNVQTPPSDVQKSLVVSHGPVSGGGDGGGVGGGGLSSA